MRILLIGDLNSSFVRDYALHLKHSKLTDLQLDLIATITPFSFAGTTNLDKVLSYPHLRLYSSFPQLRVLIRLFYLFFYILLKGRKYSHIHIHYLLIDFSVLTFIFRLLKLKPIVTVFGSDLLKISDSRKRLFKGFIRNLKLITFANRELRDNICDYYHVDITKSRICRFGLTPLEYIKDLRSKGNTDIRAIIGLPMDKIIVCVGYNFNSNQQHLKILSSLAENIELRTISERVHYIFPLTYGNEIKYKELLVDHLKTFPFSYSVYEEYLDDNSNASLRLSSDIMLQLQENDQLSGAMQEHLFSGNVVITGTWLPYSFFDELGIHMIKIRQVEDAGGILYKVIMTLNDEKRKCLNNPDLIYNASSWEHTMDDWIKLYEVAEVKPGRP
jgi:hypothetical protein